MAMLRWTWLVCATLVVAEEGKWPTCLEGGVAYTNLLDDISDAYAENRLVQEPNGGYLANAKACQESCKVAPSCKKFTFKTGSNPPGACFLIDARDDLTHRYTEHDAVSGSVIPSMTAPAGAAAEEAAAKTGEAAAGAASTGIAAADTATSAVGTAASKTGEAVTGVASTGIAAVDTATSASETAAAKTGGVAAGVASASREVPIATPIILPAPAKSKPAPAKSKPAAVVDDSEAPGPAKSLPLGPANSLAQSPANSLAQGPAKSYIAQSPSGMNSNTLWAVLGGVAVAAALGGVAAFASSSSESKKGGKRGLKISAQDEESATSIAPSPLYAPPSARPQPGPGPMAAPTPGFQPVMYFQQPQLHQVQPVPQVFYTQVPQ